MCYLRGYAFSQQANLENAKKCFKEALELDVKCYELGVDLFVILS